ncbi:MAG: hypothetical protein J7527_14425 [Chitinophagaceae bacterium]|nr:hypothetical protein [Chitinophagaceae bacterium]
MKRLAGILFISIYMLAFAEFHQLLRIPYLVKHFDYHRQIDPQISVVKFLSIHYLGPIIVDDDFTQDQQLPFRDVDSHTLIGSVVVSLEPIVISIDPPELSSAEFFIYNEVNKPQFDAIDIFQPPRCA